MHNISRRDILRKKKICMKACAPEHENLVKDEILKHSLMTGWIY